MGQRKAGASEPISALFPSSSLRLIRSVQEGCSTPRTELGSLIFFFFFFFLLFRAAPMTYRGSQARGLIRATAVGLHHSHSSTAPELCLQPTPQLMAIPDP